MNKINTFEYPPEQDLISDSLLTSEKESRRRLWELSRICQESTLQQFTPIGVFSYHFPFHVKFSINLFEKAIKCIGLYRRGFYNALNITLKSLELGFPNLPDAFDGYRILHLTDLHLDILPGLEDTIVELLKGVKIDLCAMTGDYNHHSETPIDQTLASMKKIVNAIDARDGVFATLGNHDSHSLAAPLEGLGIDFLNNETFFLERNGARMHVTGLDDVNRFYTPMADEALIERKNSFAVALVHSPEIADEAASKGYSLYLCGHTHGGQICLPWGKPILTRLVSNHDYASGLWKCGDMTGYTSPGAGVSGIPVRFFCKGEATVVTLRKETSAKRFL